MPRGHLRPPGVPWCTSVSTDVVVMCALLLGSSALPYRQLPCTTDDPQIAPRLVGRLDDNAVPLERLEVLEVAKCAEAVEFVDAEHLMQDQPRYF